MGVCSQPQPTFPSPFQNSHPLVHAQLLAQTSLNPNNNILVEYVQILEGSNNETEPVKCNEIPLRSRCIISTEEKKKLETKNNLK